MKTKFLKKKIFGIFLRYSCISHYDLWHYNSEDLKLIKYLCSEYFNMSYLQPTPSQMSQFTVQIIVIERNSNVVDSITIFYSMSM